MFINIVWRLHTGLCDSERELRLKLYGDIKANTNIQTSNDDILSWQNKFSRATHICKR